MPGKSVRVSGPVALVPADALVVRPADVLARLEGSNLKAVAADIGVEYTALWRFMRANGYTHRDSWAGEGKTDG